MPEPAVALAKGLRSIHTGRLDDAEATYLRIADRSDLDFQIRNALSSAARIKASQGDSEGAIALYQRALDTFELDDATRGLYELRIQELKTARGL